MSRAFAEANPEFGMSFEVLHIWEALEANGKADRTHIDPLIFGPKILPYLVIVDVLDDGDFRWRLFGGAHEMEYGFNLKGVSLSDLEKENEGLEEVQLIFRSCSLRNEPIFYNIAYDNRLSIRRNCCGALFPLYDYATNKVAHLLGCTEWFNLDPLA